jgi:ADP-heptose:LPS heptosyltransferase
MNLEKIKRIAVVRNNHIGDLVCTLPAFEALRQGMPHAHITAIVNPISAPLLNNHPHVDDVKFDDELDPVDQLAGILRQGRFDAVLVLWCSRRNAYAAFKARVPIRVTHGRRWVQALCGTHRCYLSRKKPPYHESAFILSFIQRLGIPFTLEQARPYLYVDPAERAKIEERITRQIGADGPLFAVHPGSRKSAYNWPVENYYQLAERLATVGRVIVTGAQPDHVELGYFESRLTPALRKRVMLIADLDLPRLVAELSLVDAFVSSSTGPLHIAAVVSRNAVGLYSDAFYQHPRRWGPIGPAGNVLISPWTFSEPPLIRSPLASQHMAQITVEQVFDRMLNPPARARAA